MKALSASVIGIIGSTICGACKKSVGQVKFEVNLHHSAAGSLLSHMLRHGNNIYFSLHF